MSGKWGLLQEKVGMVRERGVELVIRVNRGWQRSKGAWWVGNRMRMWHGMRLQRNAIVGRRTGRKIRKRVLGFSCRRWLIQDGHTAGRARLLMFEPFTKAAKMENVATGEFATLGHIFATNDAHIVSTREFFGSGLREAKFHILSGLAVAQEISNAFSEI